MQKKSNKYHENYKTKKIYICINRHFTKTTYKNKCDKKISVLDNIKHLFEVNDICMCEFKIKEIPFSNLLKALVRI